MGLNLKIFNLSLICNYNLTALCNLVQYNYLKAAPLTVPTYYSELITVAVFRPADVKA